MQIFQLRVSNKQFLDIIDKLNLSIPNLVDDPLLESDEMADSDYEKYLELARVNIYQKARLLLLKNKANLSFIEDSQAASSCEKFLSQLDEKEANIIESILNGYHEKAIKVLNELILEKGGTIDE